jgi:hypothetical protein
VTTAGPRPEEATGETGGSNCEKQMLRGP